MAKTALQQLTAKQIKELIRWYEKNHRPLPWRSNPEPYWVWLAEIMSQQTVMAALLPYFFRFIEKFPTIARLASATEDEVLGAWTGLGYYSRARNVYQTAKLIVETRSGSFPRTYDEWLDMPGVGPYTAAAIVSQCFGVKEPVWDGNVIRVTARLAARSDVWTDKSFASEMKESLRSKMHEHEASPFNQAFMELGALVCTPKSPRCFLCPNHESCLALKKGDPESYPSPKPRKKNIELSPRVHVQLRRPRVKDATFEVWLERRPDSSWFHGMWDFPSELGGVERPLVEGRVVPKQSLVEFGRVRHQITHHKITLVGMLEVVKEKRDTKTGRWVLLDDLLSDEPSLPLSTTARKVLRILMKSLPLERG